MAPARLPDFLIIGAAKSGTTSLYSILKAHPRVFMPEHKEPHYFSYMDGIPDGLENNVITDLSQYLQLFGEAKADQLIGEASTTYLYRAHTAANIIKSYHAANQRLPRILIILRNPVDRAFSHFTYLVLNGRERLSFEKAITPETISRRRNARWGFDYLEYGEYAKQVKPFLEDFDHVKIFLFEEIIHQDSLRESVFEFLGLDDPGLSREYLSNPSGIARNELLTNILTGKHPAKEWLKRLLPTSAKRMLIFRKNALLKRLVKKPEMLPQTREKLTAYYQPMVKELECLTGIDLSEWRA